MRIGGLASGMDTDALIKKMMEAKRIPLTKVTQKKQTVEWQLDSYRAVNRKLNDFSTNTWNNIIMSESFRAKTMSVSAPNDVSITNKNSTSDFSGTIKIEKLAKGATLQSGVITAGAGNPAPAAATLGSLNITDTSLTITTIDKDGNDVNTTIAVTGTDTLKDVMTKINKAGAAAGLNAFYDEKSGKIAMSSKYGGKDIAVKGDVGGNIADVLGLSTTRGTSQAGNEAVFHVNGLRMTSSTNTAEVNGFEFTFKAESNTDIEFASKPDTDAIFDTVVKFVDEYNSLIKELNSLVREETYRDFKPLSAEQKAEMSEKEIEQWEEKAKSGMLKNDSIISGMVTKMRNALMEPFQGPDFTPKSPTDKGSLLSSIGIGGSAYGKLAYQDNGMLVIDEKKLKAAIEEDPNKVHSLLATGDPNSKPGTVTPDKGFAMRIREIAENTKAAIKNRAGEAGSTNDSFTLGLNLKAMDKQMLVFEARLKMVESRLWSQFNAMEKAIQRANAQSAQLASAFGGGA